MNPLFRITLISFNNKRTHSMSHNYGVPRTNLCSFIQNFLIPWHKKRKHKTTFFMKRRIYFPATEQQSRFEFYCGNHARRSGIIFNTEKAEIFNLDTSDHYAVHYFDEEIME